MPTFLKKSTIEASLTVTACFALRYRIRNITLLWLSKTVWNECSLIGIKMLYLNLYLFKTGTLALVIIMLAVMWVVKFTTRRCVGS